MLRTICLQNIQCIKSHQKYYSHFTKTQKKILQFQQNAMRNFGRTPRTRANPPIKPNFETIPVESQPVPSNNLIKAFLFTTAFSAGTFVGVSIWEYEKLRSKFLERKNSTSFTWLKSKIDKRKNKPEWQIELEKLWNRLTPGEQVFVPIFLINTVVFGLWRIPRLQPFMMQYFCSNPAAKIVCWPMILSTFSHVSLFHIFANMFVLHSFSNAAVASLGKEQFLGLYLSAGVVSSLTSYIYKAITLQSGLSLGASGAIMAIFSYVCVAYPDTRLSILFLPMFTFSAGTAIKAVVALDMAGCIFRWKFFDHAAHLGGALFGIYWYFNGRQNVWPLRHRFQTFWDEIRTSK